MTTFNCRTDAITLQPGQNLNKYTLTKACPHAEVVERAARRRHLRRRLRREGLPDPLQAEHGRDQAERQDHDAGRLGPPPPPRRLAPARWGRARRGRGEDDRDAAAGLRDRDRRDGELGPRPHAPQPHRHSGPAGLSDLADRLGPADGARPHRHHGRPRRVHGRRQRRRLPGLRRTARASTTDGNGKFTFPRTSPPTRRSELRGGRQGQRQPVLDGPVELPRRRSRCSPPAAICIRAASTSTCRWLATGPTPGRSTATTRPRSSRCSAPTPTTTSRRARSVGTSR